MERKKRILWCSEASFLHSGFSTLSLDILHKLYKAGKYEIAELSSYAASDDPRAIDVPWKVYGAIPPKENEYAYKHYHSVQTGQFGESVFEQVCLDFRPDIVHDNRDAWMCLAANSLIYKDLGQIAKIQDVKIGDKTLTQNSEIHSVTNIFQRKFTGKTFKIKTSVLSDTLEMTGNHPVYIVETHRPRWFPKNINNGRWINAEDVKVGQYTLFPLPTFETKKTDFSNEMLEALGNFVAEGCYLKHSNMTHLNIKDGIQITGNGEEKDKFDKFINTLALLDPQSHVHNTRMDDIHPTFVIRRLGSKIIPQLLCNWFGEYAKGKSLPDWIMCLPVDQLSWFMKGLINGDGSRCHKTRNGRYYTVSETLARQTWLCLLKCGIYSSLNKGTTKIGERVFERYLLNVPKLQFDKFVKLFDFGLFSKLEHRKIIDNNIIMRIRSIEEKTVENIDVFYLEIEGSHTYVSNFLVHNCDHEIKSPFRDKYKLFWMPTVDGEPQRLQWLDDYSRADLIMTYSQYGKDILEREAPNKVKVFDVGRPGVNHELFVPMDRTKLRQEYGIDPHAQILMTVMRNQKRKLFPDLIEMFAGYLKHCKTIGNKFLEQNSYLFMHTSYPDVGYDLGKYIMEFGVGHRCLFSYYCRNCRKTAIDFFQGEFAVCKYCNKLAASMPNTSIGVSREELARLYNLADLYCQYSIAEGLACPLVEAKSCGLPALAVDYTAMAEQVNIEGCQPIKVGRFFYESCMETEQRRALPDNTDCIKKVYDYFILPTETRQRFSQLCRNDVVQNYTFERCARIFEKAIDSLEVPEHSETWLNPKGKFAPMSMQWNEPKSNSDFVDAVIDNILGKPELKNTYWKTELVKGLNVGYVTERSGQHKFDRKACIGMFQQMAKLHNYWENSRLSLLEKPDNNKISWKLI